jgi:hypothetical protein
MTQFDATILGPKPPLDAAAVDIAIALPGSALPSQLLGRTEALLGRESDRVLVRCKQGESPSIGRVSM